MCDVVRRETMWKFRCQISFPTAKFDFFATPDSSFDTNDPIGSSGLGLE
jgi:hypothetical protein